MPSQNIKREVGRFGRNFIQGTSRGVPTGFAAGVAGIKSGAGFLSKLVGKWKENRKNPEKMKAKKQKSVDWIKKFRFLREKRGIAEAKIKNSDISSVDINSEEFKNWESEKKSTLPPSPFK